MKGELAEEFCKLMRDLWSSGDSYSVSPNDFKRCIARFAPQFTGYAQHDSQELLAFLLDGLHEDLNRIRSKPPTEVPTGDGSNDVEIGELAWARHQQRNDSYVQDLFWGQYKSKVVCPDEACGKVSVTFDAFNFITLNLPQNNEISVTAVMRFADPRRLPVRYTVKVAKTACGSDLLKALSDVTKIEVERIAIAEIDRDRTPKSAFSFIKPTARIWNNGNLRLPSDGVHAYEVPRAPKEPFEPPSFYSSSSSSNYFSSSSSLIRPVARVEGGGTCT